MDEKKTASYGLRLKPKKGDSAPKYLKSVALKLEKIGSIPLIIYGGSENDREAFALHFYRQKSFHQKTVPLIDVDCRMLADDFSSLCLLFGYEKGAFSGADQIAHGFIERADGGILFLKEVQNLTPRLQQQLSRVLDGGEFQRLGDSKVHHARFQIIATSSKALSDLQKLGDHLLSFSMRLMGFEIDLSSLAQGPRTRGA